jgi:hypothetical protein
MLTSNRIINLILIAFTLLLIYSSTQVGIWGDESFILVSNDHYSPRNNLSLIDLFSSLISYEPHPLMYNAIIYFFQVKLGFGYSELIYRIISIVFWLIGTYSLINYVKDSFSNLTTQYFLIIILLSPATLLMGITIRSYSLLYMLACLLWIENQKERPSVINIGILSFFISQTHFISFVLLGSYFIYYLVNNPKSWKLMLAIALPSVFSLTQLLYLVVLKSSQFSPSQISWFPKATISYPFYIFYQLFQGNILASSESIHPVTIPFTILFMIISAVGLIKIDNQKIRKQIIIMFACIGIIWLVGMIYKNYSIPRAFIHFLPPVSLILAVGFEKIHKKFIPFILLIYMSINLIIFQKWFSFYQFSSLKTMSLIILESKSDQFIAVKQSVDVPIIKHYLGGKFNIYDKNQFVKKITSYPERPKYFNFWYISSEHESITVNCTNKDYSVELVKFHPYFKLYNIKKCSI